MQPNPRWARPCQPLPPPPTSLPTNVDSPAEPAVSTGQADPSTTPIPEEPNPTLLAQQEWYDSQDKLFQGPVPPETPWQDDDLTAQPSSSASSQPMGSEKRASPQAPDQDPWLLPKPDTCLFNIFGEPFQLQNIKESIAKGQMPHCLYKDPTAADEQPLNRQEMWAATQYKPIYRTAGRWTYWELLPDDIRRPPPQFCDEIEDAPISLQHLDLSPKKRHDPSTCLPRAAPICRPNCLRKTLGQMSQKKKHLHSLPPPPSPNQPRRPRPLPRPRSLQCSLCQLQPGRSPSLLRSSICALPRPNLFCLKTPSLCPNLCLRSLLRPPNSHRVSHHQQIVQARPKTTSRTYPQQIRPRYISLRAARTSTWMFFAASARQEPSPSPTSSTSAYWTTEPNHFTAAHTTSLLSA